MTIRKKWTVEVPNGYGAEPLDLTVCMLPMVVRMEVN